MNDDYQGRAGSSSRNNDAQLQQVVRKKTRVASKRQRLTSAIEASNQIQQVAGSNNVRSASVKYGPHMSIGGYYRSSRAVDGDKELHQQQPRADNLMGASSATDLQYQSTGMLNYQYHQHHQYSSSQAQLQSLTSPPNEAAFVSCDTLRKTPKNCINQHKQQRILQQQQQLSRSQASLAPATSTKPMTSMLNEPSLSATIERRQRSMVSISAGGAQQHPLTATPSNGAILLPGGAQTAAAHTHPLPPPYSAGDGPNSVHQQQPGGSLQSHVICYQPTQGVQPSQQFPSSSSNNNNIDNNHQDAATSSRTSQQQVPSSTSSFPVPAPQTTNSQQHILSLLNNQQACNFPFNQQHQPPYPAFLLHNLYQHQAQLNEHQAAQQANNGNCPVHHHSQQLPFPVVAGHISKSKSCLTCADISIKWYIVVIALLGLICALIGTIVGAAHSAGRDYISLALLLIGVGLVLVAISWIALRLTIKTYKSSAGRLQTQRQLSQNGRRSSQLPPNGSMGRLLASLPSQTGAQSGAPISSSLHRNLLNERLYLMAAAISARQAAAQSGLDQSSAPQQRPSSGGADNGGLLSGIKQRFARLISSSSQGTLSLSGVRRGFAVAPNACLLEAGIGASSNPNSSPNEPASSQPAAQLNPSALAAAAAILHQYPPHPGLFGLAPPPPHLFGLFPPLPAGSPDFLFRPPPPSYSASMQDQRLRMLLAERAGLQQQLNTFAQQQQQQQQQQQASASGSTTSLSREQVAAAAAANTVAADASAATNNNVPLAGAKNASRISQTNQTFSTSSPKPEGARDGASKQATDSAVMNAAEQRQVQQAAARRLKSSSSAPSIRSLVTTNDIYVPSSSGGAPPILASSLSSTSTGNLAKAASARSSNGNAPMDRLGGSTSTTIVSIGAASTAVPSGSGESLTAQPRRPVVGPNAGKQVRETGNQDKAAVARAAFEGEVKILGYL